MSIKKGATAYLFISVAWGKRAFICAFSSSDILPWITKISIVMAFLLSALLLYLQSLR